MHNKIVTPEALGEALEDFVKTADSWTFHISRPRIDWDSGDGQQESIILRPNDDVKLNPELDPRLVRSRKVYLSAQWPDGGSAVTDLTERSYQVLTGSEQSHEAISTFNKKLHKNGIRFTGPGTVALMLLWPILLWVAAIIVGTEFDPILRESFENRPQQPGESHPTPIPPWLHDTMSVSVIIWPFTILVGLALFALRTYCGGLRVKRASVSKLSLFMIIYRLRSELLRVDNWRTIMTGVVIAAAGTLFGMWIK